MGRHLAISAKFALVFFWPQNLCQFFQFSAGGCSAENNMANVCWLTNSRNDFLEWISKELRMQRLRAKQVANPQTASASETESSSEEGISSEDPSAELRES